jgi:hypothetical protein
MTETIHGKDLQLELIDELFANMSDEKFLAMHNACEKHIGPTIDEYLIATEESINARFQS